ncbi:MAG: hypothetical protein V4622_04105 [Bacteroidota bacterium]
MKVILFFLSLFFVTSSLVFKSAVKTVFAVQVNMQTNSQMYTIVVYIDNGRTLTHKKNLTKDEFVKFASGKWPSIYNPERKNLLAENNILCGLVKDSITKKDVVFCSPLDSLWKLRFSDYPFNNGKEKGWSRELYKPSSKQAIFLKDNYAVNDLDFGFFMDANFWKIMRDVQDPDWIKKYRSL